MTVSNEFGRYEGTWIWIHQDFRYLPDWVYVKAEFVKRVSFMIAFFGSYFMIVPIFVSGTVLELIGWMIALYASPYVV